MASSELKSLPQWNSIDELVDYFDSHDMGVQLANMPEAQISRKFFVAKEEEILSKLADIAKRESVSSEQLINSWLKERILETTR